MYWMGGMGSCLPATAQMWHPILKRKEVCFLYLVFLKYNVSMCLHSTFLHNKQQRPLYLSIRKANVQDLSLNLQDTVLPSGGGSRFTCLSTTPDMPGLLNQNRRCRDEAWGFSLIWNAPCESINLVLPCIHFPKYTASVLLLYNWSKNCIYIFLRAFLT